MMRWRAAAYGAVAFLAAHAVILWQWTALAGDHAGEPRWFANSSGSVSVAVIAMAVAGVIAAHGTARGHERTLAVANVSLGGIAGMIGAMLMSGGGTIAPLAVVMGGAVLVSGAFAGGIVASLRPSRR